LKEKAFNIVYITTNLINGKQYVGDHCTDNLNDNYLGSGLAIRGAIKYYGKENFKREILEHCTNKQEAFDFQEKYINLFNTLRPNGYNISPKGGHNVAGCISEETKRKISNSEKGKIISIEQREKISNSLKGRVFSTSHKNALTLAATGKLKLVGFLGIKVKN